MTTETEATVRGSSPFQETFLPGSGKAVVMQSPSTSWAEFLAANASTRFGLVLHTYDEILCGEFRGIERCVAGVEFAVAGARIATKLKGEARTTPFEASDAERVYLAGVARDEVFTTGNGGFAFEVQNTDGRGFVAYGTLYPLPR